MNLIESTRIAMRGLSANKLRAVLTMLGIIIGVGAVITLLSVGQGVEKLITEQLQSAGTNLLFVIPVNINDDSSAGPPGMTSFEPSLTAGDLDALRDPFNAPDIALTAPEVNTRAVVTQQKKSASLQVSGVTPEYQAVRNTTTAEGSFISDQDVAGRARVAVLGVRALERLFEPDEYAIGRTIKINRIPFQVIGIMEEKGGGAFGSEDDLIYVPLSTVQERLMPDFRNSQGESLLSTIYIQVNEEENMDAARQQIEEVLRQRHNIQFRDDDDFTVINQADLVEIFGQITGVLTIFLGAIAAISLLVGGIGIMNIMLVSVTERTREIGIRKAVGARRKDILLQFLIEAMVLSLIGGIIGIALGWAGALAISNLQDDLTAVVTLQSVLLATGFSLAVGLFFGIYPATRAASLNPIDALRYE
jgi:putative ABC transport system permease protein